MTIIAKYEDGVFKALENFSLLEGSLVEVNVLSYADRLKEKSPSIRGFSFFGMWKDRTDIADSIEYVSSLRQRGRWDHPTRAGI